MHKDVSRMVDQDNLSNLFQKCQDVITFHLSRNVLEIALLPNRADKMVEDQWA